MNREIALDVLNPLDGALAKEPLDDARNQVDHDDVVPRAEVLSELGENLHAFRAHKERGCFRDRRALGLNVLSKLSGELEDRVFENTARH